MASTETTIVNAATAPSWTFPGMTHPLPATANNSQMPPSLRTGQNFLGWEVTSLWPSCRLASLRESYRQHLASTWYKSPAPSSHRDTAQAKFLWLSGTWNLEEVNYQLSPCFWCLLPLFYPASLNPLQVSPESSFLSKSHRQESVSGSSSWELGLR